MSSQRWPVSVDRGAASRRGGARRQRCAAGSGLVEVMVTVGFLAIAFLGLAGSTVGVARGHTASRNAAAATALAQQRLEALRSLPVGAPGLTSGTYQDSANPMTADGASGGIFNRTWVVSAPDVPGIGLKTVTVTVGWTDYDAHQTSVSAYVRCSTVPCP